LEKSDKLLSKVRISGGGRCNVTHHCFDNRELVKNYPRGNKELLQVFAQFSVQNTIDWFNAQGIELKTEEDGRMFPVTDSSETIIDCFLSLTKKLDIEILKHCEVFAIHKKEKFQLKTSAGMFEADAVICALGGHPKSGAYDVLKNLGHSIVSPLPSLFTLNFPNESIKKELQGLSVATAGIKVAGTKLNYNGPVLITHWGLSGPAVLKLSAFAAKDFFEMNYRSKILVNWAFPLKTHEVEEELKQVQKDKNKSLPYNTSLFQLPKRLWEFLCLASGIDNTKPWAEISRKNLLTLAEKIANSSYEMEGKTTFKEEFVTCGGVALKEIDFNSLNTESFSIELNFVPNSLRVSSI